MKWHHDQELYLEYKKEKKALSAKYRRLFVEKMRKIKQNGEGKIRRFPRLPDD